LQPKPVGPEGPPARQDAPPSSEAPVNNPTKRPIAQAYRHHRHGTNAHPHQEIHTTNPCARQKLSLATYTTLARRVATRRYCCAPPIIDAHPHPPSTPHTRDRTTGRTQTATPGYPHITRTARATTASWSSGHHDRTRDQCPRRPGNEPGNLRTRGAIRCPTQRPHLNAGNDHRANGTAPALHQEHLPPAFTTTATGKYQVRSPLRRLVRGHTRHERRRMQKTESASPPGKYVPPCT